MCILVNWFSFLFILPSKHINDISTHSHFHLFLPSKHWDLISIPHSYSNPFSFTFYFHSTAFPCHEVNTPLALYMYRCILLLRKYPPIDHTAGHIKDYLLPSRRLHSHRHLLGVIHNYFNMHACMHGTLVLICKCMLWLCAYIMLLI